MPAGRVARGVLRLYPRRLREEFGDEITAFLADRQQRSSGRGWMSRAILWLSLARDLTASLWRERRVDLSASALMATFSGFRRDVRHAWRDVRRAPGTSGLIVLILAATIAAATLVFSLVNAVLLRPLPYGDPERLVVVWEQREGRAERNVVAGHEFPEWRRRTRAFEGLTAVAFPGRMTLTGAGDAAAIEAVRVTGGFTETMGVRPALGRSIRDDEFIPGHGAVALISDRLWRDHFAGDGAVLGRRVLLEGRPFEVVGVMPKGFAFPPTSASGDHTPDLWLPLDEPIHLYRGRHYLYVVGRRAADVSLSDAQSDMDRVTRELRSELPDLNRGHGALVVPLHGDLVRGSRASLWLVFAAVGCLLLIGCGNVAGLLTARGLSRRREYSLRLALGASRGSVVRQLLTESLFLAAVSGALGVAVVFAVARVLPAIVPPEILMLSSVPIDAAVLMFALAATAATGVLFGLAPAAQSGRVGFAEVLSRGGRSLAGGDGTRARRALVVSQIGLTLVLVLAAGVLIRALVALHAVDPGFRTEGLLAVDVSLSNATYPAPVQQRQFFADLASRLHGRAGVTSVSTANAVPLGGAMSGIAIGIEGATPPPTGEGFSARYRIVGPGYFQTLRIPVRAGREFGGSDARLALPLVRWFPQQSMPAGLALPQPPPVAVVNETMARAFWPGATPIGRRFTVLFSPPIEIVGVVADTFNDSLRQPPTAEFYLCDLQEPQKEATILVRTSGEPVEFAPMVRAEVRAIDPDVPVGAMRPMTQVVAAALGLPRFTSALVGGFAMIALVLMSAGIYGVIAFATARRLPEIGVRMALGARPATIRRAILREGVLLALMGCALGAGLAWAALCFLRADVIDAAPPDALTFAIVCAVITGTAIAACWLPASRASRTDPIVVLRQE